MKKNIDREIIDIVIDFYLTSGDFNGIPLSFLLSQLHVEFEEIDRYLSNKISDCDLRILSSDNERNPHIIRTGFQNIETQLKSLRKNNVDHTCIYPGIEILKRRTSSEYLTDQPFRRELALGRGQLDLCYFELMLLELYRNDPRYYYNCNDIGGSICIKDEHYKDSTFDERDKVLLEAFGLAYDNDGNRYIAAFIGDLANLSPEHQRIWQSKIVNSELKVNPDFYGSQILGQWAQHISIFDAVLHEQRIINDMVCAIGKPPLFKRVFGRYLEEKPKEFSFMIRPTAKEYHDFVHLLDKLFSDNIDKKFFKGELALEVETERRDGKIIVGQKGTIVLLDEWLRKVYRASNWEPWDFAISVFKKIRDQRSPPAHSIIENKFEPKYIHQQRELMKEAYEALAILRHALGSHPKCETQDFDIPSALIEGKIWTM